MKKIVSWSQKCPHQSPAPHCWDEFDCIFQATCEDLSVEVMTGYCIRSDARGYIISVSKDGERILLHHREEIEATTNLIEKSCAAIYENEVGLFNITAN